VTRGNKIRARTSWEWEAQAQLAAEEAAACLRIGMPDRAARYSKLSIAAQEAARVKRLSEKHSPKEGKP
jgi:hypothetical protein